ncbi:MAG: virulence RhuM family protein [Planctomycetes bacterium]|nr:virulence RhuM family protein [Planctomycetota bacterium]
MSGEVVVFVAKGGRVRMDVRLDGETVWLSLDQIARLFERDKSVVSRHLRNVFASGELKRRATVAKSATVQREGDREVTRQVQFYNLDAILSVGYRVNSKRGTQFRIWATSTLREHLVRGFTLNERRLRERGFADIDQAVGLLAKTLSANALVGDEGAALLDVVKRYTHAWHLLLAYDEERLPSEPGRPMRPTARLTHRAAREAIDRLQVELSGRAEASALFGRERGEQLAGLLGAIEQTFDGKPLYPSVQQRAAHLLYFVIKDHPFADGNKRVGALLFLEYLRLNGLLVRADGQARIAANAMVALALLVAASEASHKDLMIRLILNLLHDADA